MGEVSVRTVEDAFALLAELGASAHLIRHHALVVEAAEALLHGLAPYAATYDAQSVLLGAALHDAGKILHPMEMRGPGNRHEDAGRALLERHGHPTLARFCVTHAAWDRDALELEDLLVALADKLWKGKRVEALETRVIQRLASALGRELWDVFTTADAAFERVAADGDRRLARSDHG